MSVCVAKFELQKYEKIRVTESTVSMQRGRKLKNRAAKVRRILNGEPIRALDLFAGCGGLSLGFHSAGFKIVGALESDEKAAKSHALNFSTGDSDDHVTHGRGFDIRDTEPAEFIQSLALGADVDDSVDVLMGGPPCQAFARVGRAKLRDLASHPSAYLKDPRSNLYLRFLEYVKALQPIAILMENVPDALNYGGHNIARETAEVLSDMGYKVRYTLLNAVHYGVPQMRERMFLIAFDERIRSEIRFPEPTHYMELPQGYQGTRSVALKSIQESPSLFNDETYYVPTPQCDPGLPPAVTAEEALGDLPPITLHLRGELGRGARRFDELIPYGNQGKLNAYAELMRTWPGFENREGIFDHVIRYLPRDYKIFRVMNPGDQYPEAHEHAWRLFGEHLAELSDCGSAPKEGTEAYLQLQKEFVPPYDPTKFPNKWRKMEPDAPARTLMAHLGKDSYSHIHYDSEQARTISVREAARLQSFPDGFVFAGTMNPAFRQIGNAVPPLLSLKLAKVIKAALEGGTE